MILGILLKGLNALLSRNKLDFFFEFVPQLLFLFSTFGYMAFLIIVKWLSSFDKGLLPPSILNIMLSIPLKLGDIKEEENLLQLF